MGGMQTILALLAVTLFSTLTISSYNNLTSQSDIFYTSYLNLLGQDSADAFFEKINCELIGKVKTLSQVYTENHNVNDTVVIPDLSTGGSFITFQRHRDSYYCNDDGSTSATPTHNVKITMYMTSSYGQKNIYVGTATNPVVRVFSEPGL